MPPPDLAPTVAAYWRITARVPPAAAPTGPGSPVPDRAQDVEVVLDETLPAGQEIEILEPVGGRCRLTLTSAAARRLGLSTAAPAGEAAGSGIGRGRLLELLETAGVPLNGADLVHCLPLTERERLLAARSAAIAPAGGADRVLTRALGPQDAAAFAAFLAAAPEQDADEAFVELDHWLVHGTFAADRLVCAASMYPWRGSVLADLGVLTLPEHRGHGLARATVRSLCADALARGAEPQYRCQSDNTASVALALSAGFVVFARWDVGLT